MIVQMTPRERSGLVYAVAGALLFSLMGAFLYAARVAEPGLGVGATACARVLMNFALCFLPIAAIRGASPRTLFADLKPRPLLLAWAACAAVSLSTYNGAILEIGTGQASFLQSSQTIFIAFLAPLLAPLLARQTVDLFTWGAIAGAFVGIALMHDGSLAFGGSTYGELLAIAAGLSSALAYLALARLGERANPRAATLYWCFGVALATGAIAYYETAAWPHSALVWAMLFFSGVLASADSLCFVIAFQRAPAAYVSMTGFLTPVASTAIDARWFGIIPSTRALAGAALVLLFGLAIPFLRGRESAMKLA